MLLYVLKLCPVFLSFLSSFAYVLMLLMFFLIKEELGLLLVDDLRVICKNFLFGEVTKLLVLFCINSGLGMIVLTLIHPFL
jgi:hypothetical protein